MYRVIFHPQMVSVCEKVNYAAAASHPLGVWILVAKVGASFAREPAVAIYANLAKPAGVDERFEVRIFVESKAQHRALYLFSAPWPSVAFASAVQSGGRRGRHGGAPPGAPRPPPSAQAFVVYGAPPGGLFSEASPRAVGVERRT